MNWLARHLFGTQASQHLADKIEAAVAAYLLAQPAATIADVKAQVIGQGDAVLSAVLKFVPAWARPLLLPLLDTAVSGLVDDAYNTLAKLAKGASPAAH